MSANAIIFKRDDIILLGKRPALVLSDVTENGENDILSVVSMLDTGNLSLWAQNPVPAEPYEETFDYRYKVLKAISDFLRGTLIEEELTKKLGTIMIIDLKRELGIGPEEKLKQEYFLG